MATTRTVPLRIAFTLADACEARIGQRPEIVGPPEADTRTLTFATDLSAADQATVDLILLAVGAAVAITPEERAALEPHLATMREFQQRSQGEFMNLTAAERDRALFGLGIALIRFDRAILRD